MKGGRGWQRRAGEIKDEVCNDEDETLDAGEAFVWAVLLRFGD